ncbi:MAG: hypothetical protein CMJ48_00160 [Planctomycetaceae bacterium]|nr:hypothetical protein [Planctomycetaceae bacterium]
MDDDYENWDDEYDDDDGESYVVPCPNCGTEVYEDAEQCPSCGDYIVPGTSALSNWSPWWVLLGFLGVLATIIVFIRAAWWN